jgi:hypothetical protein
MGSNPAEVDGFLKVIKICNTTSFGRSHIIYSMEKNFPLIIRD